MFNFIKRWKKWKKKREIVSPNNKIVNSYIYDFEDNVSIDNRLTNARFDYYPWNDEETK